MDRVPPHNLDAERAALSAVLLDNQALVTVMEMLEPEDFYLDAHRTIFSSMREMFDKGTPVDLITLTDHLQATARLEAVGGPAAVSVLGGLVSTAANVGHWAEIVKDKALLRRLVNEATGLITEAYGEPEEVEEFLDRAEGKILEISTRQTQTTYRPIKPLVEEPGRSALRLQGTRQAHLRLPERRPHHHRRPSVHGQDRPGPRHHPQRLHRQ
jgi:replicative DNA helicase